MSEVKNVPAKEEAKETKEAKQASPIDNLLKLTSLVIRGVEKHFPGIDPKEHTQVLKNVSEQIEYANKLSQMK